VSRYVLHPGAFADLDDIWQFIAAVEPDLARMTRRADRRDCCSVSSRL